MFAKFWSKTLSEKDLLENLGVDGRMDLVAIKMHLKEWRDKF